MRAMKLAGKFLSDERGMETVEWAVLAALVTTGIIAVLTSLGTNVKARFTTLSTAA